MICCIAFFEKYCLCNWGKNIPEFICIVTYISFILPCSLFLSLSLSLPLSLCMLKLISPHSYRAHLRTIIFQRATVHAWHPPSLTWRSGLICLTVQPCFHCLLHSFTLGCFPSSVSGIRMLCENCFLQFRTAIKKICRMQKGVIYFIIHRQKHTKKNLLYKIYHFR